MFFSEYNPILIGQSYMRSEVIMNLQEARQKIDELDKVLITTFEQRLKVILEIAKIKENENLGIYEPEREQDVALCFSVPGIFLIYLKF